MPGAPLEPGKALKEGGGPYGFPGAVHEHGKYICRPRERDALEIARMKETHLRMDCTPSSLQLFPSLCLSRRNRDFTVGRLVPLW